MRNLCRADVAVTVEIKLSERLADLIFRESDVVGRGVHGEGDVARVGGFDVVWGGAANQRL